MVESSVAGIEPIIAHDIPTMIAERLRKMIADGDFQPGQQLIEVALAKAFGVSRGPVREAMQRLTQEGLLVSEHNRGTRVPVLGRADVEDVYVLRGALELAAMELLMRSDSDTALSELDSVLDGLQDAESANDFARADELDHEFHRRLVHLSGSPRLAHAFDRISIESMVCLRMLKFSHPSHPDIVEWHRRFVDAIRAKDPGAARDAVAYHNGTVLRDLFSDEDDHHGAPEGTSL